MAESEKKQAGDGQDNYMNAAKQGANAVKSASKAIGEKAAARGAEAVANSAAATVKAGAQAGKAVANITAGTAAGGPWGAIISAAWSMRHTIASQVLVSIGPCNRVPDNPNYIAARYHIRQYIRSAGRLQRQFTECRLYGTIAGYP